MKWDTDPLLDQPFERKGPFEGNQAVPTLIFRKQRQRFLDAFPKLNIIREQTMDILLYPLSGGFHNPSLCPRMLWGVFGSAEDLLNPLSDYLAFRLFLVLEKSPTLSHGGAQPDR